MWSLPDIKINVDVDPFVFLDRLESIANAFPHVAPTRHKDIYGG
jgi:hypothetical protein